MDPINEPIENKPVESKPKPKKPKGGARETLYRVTMRNQLQSVGIADQKANIIIGINTILISIIIATLGFESLGRQLSFMDSIELALPFTIMLIACVFSGMTALMVVRPITSAWSNDGTDKIFFADFKNMDPGQFQEYMRRIAATNESVYHSLNNDLLLLGRIVLRKFRLLRIAYFIFLVGLVSTVFIFLLLRWT